MAKILIVYGTKEGQTKKIAERIAETLRNRNYDTEVKDAQNIPSQFSVTGYSGILVGSSVHMGRWVPAVTRFIQRYREDLGKVDSGFFSCSLSDANGTPEQRNHFDAHIKRYLKDNGWNPETIGRFGGALAWTRYGFFTRMVMLCAAKVGGQPHDTSKDFEYTDWKLVEQFGNDFASEVGKRVQTTAQQES